MALLINEVIRVPVESVTVVGRLHADKDGWSFSSSDAAFLELFPEGTVFSFRDYGIGVRGKHTAHFKKLVEIELQKMPQSGTGT
jgi:hypothetical protein